MHPAVAILATVLLIGFGAVAADADTIIGRLIAIGCFGTLIVMFIRLAMSDKE